MSYYRDLREYIQALEQDGKLFRIRREINKDTELHPLVRWQYRGGIADKDRRAFLFENSVDVKGRKYTSPVLIAAHAASREVYAMAMMCKPEDIARKWDQAQRRPVKPRSVASGPVQEEVHVGKDLLEHGGVEEFPIPISTPGFDNAPYFSAGNWISKDPDTGVYNVGNYRAMVKSPTRLGISCRMPQHIRMNLERYKEKGHSAMPAAVVIGPTPNVGLVSVTKIPYSLSEYDVAGAIAGEPIELVKCLTNDLEVPANAEIVFEGEIPTDYVEREGPFGEYTGYMAVARPNPFFNVTCITHRKRPVWNAFLSQFPPSESSLLVRIGFEAAFYSFLKNSVSLHNLVDVAFDEASGGRQYCVICLKNPTQAQAWSALNAAVGLMPNFGKIFVVVDDDIDPHDPDSVNWALVYRMQPDRDLRVTPGKGVAMDPSAAHPSLEREVRQMPYSSALMINATRKWEYPPVSLPKKEFMERARRIWEEEGLPPLAPKVPWFGTSLGYWTEQDEEEAELALKGEHFQTGKKMEQGRKKP